MTAIHHPAPLNQFYRLDFDDVHNVWVKTTPWNNVINGHDFDAENCMATEGAVAIEAHTNGATHSSPTQIRNHQDDLSGGIGVDDVAIAWQRLWGQTFATPGDFGWYDVLAAVRARRHVAIGVDYGDVPYAYQVQKGGTFDHALGIDDFRPSDGAILRYDSLDIRARWVPQSAIRAAAESLAIRVRGSAGRLFVGITRPRPLIVTEQRYRVAISGYTPIYASPGGSKVGAVSRATYICTRSKVNLEWWYRIVSKADGTGTANAGRYFRPNANVIARYA